MMDSCDEYVDDFRIPMCARSLLTPWRADAGASVAESLSGTNAGSYCTTRARLSLQAWKSSNAAGDTPRGDCVVRRLGSYVKWRRGVGSGEETVEGGKAVGRGRAVEPID